MPAESRLSRGEAIEKFIENAGTAVISVAVIGAWWVFIALDLSRALVREVHSKPASVVALIAVVCALAVAASGALTRYVGPVRASSAEILAFGGARRPARDVLGAVLVCAALACAVVVLAVALGAVFLKLGTVAWLLAFVAVALSALMPLAGAFAQRQGYELIPRWSLLRAHASSGALAASVISFDTSAMRAEADLSRGWSVKPKKRRADPVVSRQQIKVPGLRFPLKARLPLFVGRRALARRWLLIVWIVLLPGLSVLLGSANISLILLASGAVMLSGSLSTVLLDTASATVTRRMLAHAYPAPVLSVALVLCVCAVVPVACAAVPVFLAFSHVFSGPILAPGGAASWLATLAAAVLCPLFGKVGGALKAGRTGVKFINSNEFGPLPVDLVERLLAGVIGPILALLCTLSGWSVLALLVAGVCIAMDMASTLSESKHFA